MTDYEQLTETGEWLEDSKDCSRYLDEDGHSYWVCHDCEEILDEDPIEHSCC